MSATDEVWRLQNGKDPECQHFRKIADKGHYRNHESTRQGIYVCTANGKLLGSMNTHNPKAVLKMMKSALKEYASLDKDERLMADSSAIQPKHRWEDSYPENGLELTMVTRDLPESGDPASNKGQAWNQDRVWFSADEAKKFFPADLSTARKGDEYELDITLLDRFTRFSIIDTVRGQTSNYSKAEVASSKVMVSIESIDAEKVQMTFRGKTSAESSTSRGRDFPHGVKTELLGSATFDRKQQKFETFQWLLLGKRWGRTVFNGRHNQLKPSAVGFVIQLTPKDAPRIAPSFLFAYRAKWVKH